MPQLIIKLSTYDPSIIEAFEQLRKSRKQAAFAHEALKHFMSSEIGVIVVQLMTENHQQLIADPSVNVAEPIRVTGNSTGSTKGTVAQSTAPCLDVLEQILK